MKSIFTILLLASSLSLCAQRSAVENAAGDSNAREKTHPTDIAGILCFWDFQEADGSDRLAVGKYPYALQEMNGPIARVEDGIFGPYSIDFEWGQWLRIKREHAPGLDLHGDDQQVTIVAWVKRESDRAWQHVAGMWDEGLAQFQGKAEGEGAGAPARQYALIISGTWQTDNTTYERVRASHQAHGYVSPQGGATPGHPFAFDYATGGTVLKKDRWYMVAYTFDGQIIKVYVDGVLDANERYNPFEYDDGIYDGGSEGADFTVALRRVPKFPTYPEGLPENASGFDGRIGGLAVYDRALTSKEIKALYAGSMSKDSVD